MELFKKKSIVKTYDKDNKKPVIKTVRGDITKITDVQAIVNAANNSLLGGGGVDGAIHRAAGPKFLARCYFNSMKLAMDKEIRSSAFPSISTGIYGFPVELAAKIAVYTVDRFLQDNPGSFDLVEWVLFDSHTESVYEAEVDRSW